LRGEGDSQKSEPQKAYVYEKCQGCGAKLHVGARLCLKCGADYSHKCSTGEWQQVIYGSSNPEDDIYSRPMNRIEKCMQCANVTQRGIVCERKFCFGIGRKGNCEACKEFNFTVYECCQGVQREEEALARETENEWRSRGGIIATLAQQKSVNPKARGQYDDEIPF
jgi:hypothetical protein